MTPFQVQSWNPCERHQQSYAVLPDERLTLRGVPAAFFEHGMRLELYLPRSTVVLYSAEASRQTLMNAVLALTPVVGAGIAAESTAAPPACTP